jgi:hypothetical protein
MNSLALTVVGGVVVGRWAVVLVVATETLVVDETVRTVVTACVDEGTVAVAGDVGGVVTGVVVAVVAVLAVVDGSAARFADFSAPQATSSSPAPTTTATSALFIAGPLSAS